MLGNSDLGKATVRTSDPAPLASSMELKSRRAARYNLSGFLIEVGVPMVPFQYTQHVEMPQP
jgi:hypothetical protein